MRFLIVAIFVFGLLASFAAYDIGSIYTAAQRRAFGATAVTAMIATVVMVVTLL